jgi:peroxiredoxin
MRVCASVIVTNLIAWAGLIGALKAQTRIETIAAEIDLYAGQEQLKLGIESRVLVAERLTVADPVTARRMLDRAIPGLKQLRGKNYLTYKWAISYARIDQDAAEKASAEIPDRAWVDTALIEQAWQTKDHARAARLIQKAEREGQYSLGAELEAIHAMPPAQAEAALREHIEAFPVERAGIPEIRNLLRSITFRPNSMATYAPAAVRGMFQAIDRPDFDKSTGDFNETASFTVNGKKIDTKTSYETFLLPCAAFLAVYYHDAFLEREPLLPEWGPLLRDIRADDLAGLVRTDLMRKQVPLPGAPKYAPLPEISKTSFDEAMKLAHGLEAPRRGWLLYRIVRLMDLTLEQREMVLRELLVQPPESDAVSRFNTTQRLFWEIQDKRVDSLFREGAQYWIAELERAASLDDFYYRSMLDRGDIGKAFVKLGEVFEQRDFALAQKHPSIAVRMLLKELDRAAAARADFSLNSTQGVEYKLSSLKGKVVLIDFWATWCPPCRDAIPGIETLYRELGAKGLVVLGIDDEAPGVIDSFRSKNGVTYPTLVDRDRKIHNLFGVDGDAQGIPTTLVFDRDGNYVGHVPYPHNEENMRAAIKRAGLE